VPTASIPPGALSFPCIQFGPLDGLRASAWEGHALFFMHARRSPRRFMRGKNFRIEFSRGDEMRRRSLLRREDSAKPNPKGDGEVCVRELKGGGDFRSAECIDILKDSDIVVTNPPFSLFCEYIEQLAKYKKKFLIIGNVNSLTYKEVFPLIKGNELWLGASIHSGDRKFGVPADYPLNATSCGVDENGQRFIRVKGVRWFTNLDYPQRHEKLPLYKKYSPEEFPKYDNYDAIEVAKTSDIPYDYDGAMGVPITFMDKYNPEQFELIGCSCNWREVSDTPRQFCVAMMHRSTSDFGIIMSSGIIG